MGLIECPDCKKQVSDLAPTCPNCGRPIMGVPEATGEGCFLRSLNIGCIVALLLFALSALVFIIGLSLDWKGNL